MRVDQLDKQILDLCYNISVIHRIGLNAHLLNLSASYRGAGISWYSFHLLRHLTPAPDLAYTVFLSEPRAREQLTHLTVARSRLPTQQPLARIFWEQGVQPFVLRQEQIALLHGFAYAGPLASAVPWLVTIHDLSFIRYPETFNAANRLYLTWAVRHAARHARCLLAVSESTKRDLVELLGADARKIAVIYSGIEARFAPVQDRAALDTWRAQRHLPAKMILFVGTLEPRKNVAHLIHAFARFKRATHLPHKLVLAGSRGWKYAQVDAAIEQEEMNDHVIFTGYLPQAELPLCYQAAELFVYPSRYEGMGFPPLEAMATGVPVITSNVSSLPEVAGDAALQVSPDDPVALAEAMAHVLSDTALREQMIARGLAHAATFTWERTAHQTADLYRALLAQREA